MAEAPASEPADVAIEAALREAGRDDPKRAAELLGTVLAQYPGHPQVLLALAATYRRAGRLRDAVLACDAAIRAAPTWPDAWLERAFVLAAGGSTAAARDNYERVVALAPDHAAAHAGIAGIAARDGDAMAGRAHAASALASDPGNAIALCALAAIELEAGEAASARVRLEPLVAALAQPCSERVEALSLLGDACARLNDPAAAYDAFRRSNHDFALLHETQFAGRPPHRQFIEAILAQIPALRARPASPPPGPAAAHVFLLGYPRSGTTLVENVLASHPAAVALEERPTLAAASRAFLADPQGLIRFDRLGDAELKPYRADYWQQVAAAGGRPEGKCFVDMDPLKATRLPLIERLFPEARILVMRRDPRDVVWSCFRTRFGLTNAAMDFTTLEGTARHYDAMMRLTEMALARFPSAAHVVPYQRLVTDFDATTRDLCSFVGLEWNAALREFARTARKRGVATASAGQVRRGLYDGTGQWEPYGEWLAPVMPILAPWVEKFGYAA